MKTRKSLLLIAIVLCLAMLAACANGNGEEETNGDTNGGNTTVQNNQEQREPLTLGAPAEVNPTARVRMTIAGMGDVIIGLDANIAPITVENFLNLTREGFYDGLAFHRIIDGFMVQGGCPYGTGTGGAENNITGEVAQNGIENNLRHTRGVISMAHSGPPDSGSSQFFIMLGEAPWLDGVHAAFGEVIEGMEVIDGMAQIQGVDGIVAEADRPVIESMTIIED